MRLFLAFVFSTFLQVSSAQTPVSNIQLFDTVYTKPEVLASFPGGEKAWKQYIKKNLKYPRKAWWDEVESDVVIKVIVEKDGTVSEVIHLTVSNYGFEQEAVRLIRKSGRWVAATHRGRPVKSEGMLTIEFRLK